MTELTDATVDVRSDTVVLTYTLSEEEPSAGHWTLSTMFRAGGEGPVDHLGFKFLDGSLIAAWAMDLSGGAGNRYYETTPQRLGRQWSIAFPRTAVRSGSGSWFAALDLNGDDGGEVTGSY